MAELKTQPTSASVAEFLEGVEQITRKRDAYLLAQMMEDASGVEPVMWGPSIVGFGHFHYRYATGHEGDMPVISFSPRKAAMSVYGVYYPGYESHLEGLGPYKTGKWCLYLGSFENLNLDVLQRAVKWAWNNGKPVIANQLSAEVQ